MNRAQKIAAFPLRAPRQLTLAWWPWHAVAAAVDGYHAAFFAVLDRRPL